MEARPHSLNLVLPSGAQLIRFSNLEDIFWYDIRSNNPNGIGFSCYGKEHFEQYLDARTKLTKDKIKLIDRAKRELELDKDLLSLVYKGKSDKRERTLNKFGGNLSMPHYASQSEKFFHKFNAGKKKKVINMAFQVGTFIGGNYEHSYFGIIKSILAAQALGISLNIDMFDSDTEAIDNGDSYVIVNVCKSSEKLDLKKILMCSHQMFFSGTLFNGYSASGEQARIGTFLPDRRIIHDLGSRYDVIGGNLLNSEGNEMVQKILKIGNIN